MQNIVVGIVAVLIGALLCFRGYVTMRVIISLFGAFIGFVLGAGLVAGVTDSGFGQVALSWLVGIVGAVLFGILAYFSYQLAVIIGMAGIGFTLGTTLVAALGGSEATSILVGVIAAVALAVISIVTDLPAIILIILTALAGASITVSGVMLLVGGIAVNRLTPEGLTAAMDRGWWWYAAYAVLVVLGIVAQLRARVRRDRPARAQWSTPAREHATVH